MKRSPGKPNVSPSVWRSPISDLQKANRERFGEAIFYARQAIADPKIRAHYEKVARKAKRQPFRVAVSDFRSAEGKPRALRGSDLLCPAGHSRSQDPCPL